MPERIRKRNNVNILGEGGKTLIFAHGFGTDQTAWHTVADAFKDSYRIVLYDNVGGGKTDPSHFSPQKYSQLEAYANDLLEIADELKLNDAVFIGHSVSGMIGLLAAVKAPEHFSKCIMVGASPRYLNDEGYTGGFEQEHLNSFYQAMEMNYYAWVSGFASAAMTYPERPELAQGFAATLSSIRPDIAQSVARTIFQSDYRHMLPELKHETLIIQSTNDIAVPQEVGEYLHKHIPNSKLVKVSATGHFPHISEPQQIINALKKFI